MPAPRFLPAPGAATAAPGRRRLLHGLAAAGAAALLAGCASLDPPPVLGDGDRLSGRLAVRVEGDASRSFSAAFDLQGRPERGLLALASPTGSQLAQAAWSPQRVELRTPQGARRYADLAALAEDALGEPVPLQALFDWLAARPWPGAPSRALDGGTGFEQLGWRVDTSRHADGLLVAERRGDGQPTVTVRIRLDA